LIQQIHPVSAPSGAYFGRVTSLKRTIMRRSKHSGLLDDDLAQSA
jgi:hypothetical protein